MWYNSLCYEDDHRTGCRNLSHCQQQQSNSGPCSPGRSYSTYFWSDPWVQTFHSCTNCIKLCNYAIHVDTMTNYIMSGLFRIILLIAYGDQTNLLLDTYDSLFTLLWICISNYVKRTHWGPGIMTLFNEFKSDFILINISLLYMLWEVDSFLFFKGLIFLLRFLFLFVLSSFFLSLSFFLSRRYYSSCSYSVQLRFIKRWCVGNLLASH